MYLDLLEEAVQEIKGEAPPPKINPEILLQIEAYIPEEYVPDPQQRMNLYKRLSRSTGDTEINEIEDEIFDLYGKAPIQVTTLIRVMRLRLLMKELLIIKLDYNGKDLTFVFNEDTSVNPAFLALWAQQDKRVRLFPENKFSYRVGTIDPESRINQCFGLLRKLETGMGAQKTPGPASGSHLVTKIRKAESLKTG